MDTSTKEFEDIREILSGLPAETVREVRDFASYLADREERRKAFVAEVHRAEQETPIRFKTAAEAMAAIRNEAGV